MALEAGESSGTTPERTTLIRGADGKLYALSDTDLAPFRGEKEKETTDILKKAKEDRKPAKLSDSVVQQIQAVQGCVHTTAASPEIYTNTKE